MLVWAGKFEIRNTSCWSELNPVWIIYISCWSELENLRSETPHVSLNWTQFRLFTPHVGLNWKIWDQKHLMLVWTEFGLEYLHLMLAWNGICKSRWIKPGCVGTSCTLNPSYNRGAVVYYNWSSLFWLLFNGFKQKGSLPEQRAFLFEENAFSF